jgi:GT2 family glycosyltransferase
VDKVLCSVATRGRYQTTLPLTLNAIINQTKKVDKLIIFDDNDEPQDMRNELVYSYFFQMLDIKGIQWEWLYAQKKGQHHIHQMANTMGFDWVWRVDDDAIPEPNVLQTLFNYTSKKVGAVGGAILTPPLQFEGFKPTGTEYQVYIWMDQVLVAPASTSEAVRVPVAVAVPATAVPLSRLPASVTEPARAAAALVTTGTSLVPLMVTVMV